MERKWKRRNYFIKREFQGRYILSLFALVIIGSILLTAIFTFCSELRVTMNCFSSGKTPSLCLAEMLRTYWMSIISGGIIGAVIWAVLTHRVAGPLYRFERTIDKMALGDLDFNIKLRKHDEGKDLAEAVNRLKNILASNIDSMRELSDEIDSNLKRSSVVILDGQGDVQALINQTRTINGQLKQILDSYTAHHE